MGMYYHTRFPAKSKEKCENDTQQQGSSPFLKNPRKFVATSHWQESVDQLIWCLTWFSCHHAFESNKLSKSSTYHTWDYAKSNILMLYLEIFILRTSKIALNIEHTGCDTLTSQTSWTIQILFCWLKIMDIV